MVERNTYTRTDKFGIKYIWTTTKNFIPSVQKLVADGTICTICILMDRGYSWTILESYIYRVFNICANTFCIKHLLSTVNKWFLYFRDYSYFIRTWLSYLPHSFYRSKVQSYFCPGWLGRRSPGRVTETHDSRPAPGTVRSVARQGWGTRLGPYLPSDQLGVFSTFTTHGRWWGGLGGWRRKSSLSVNKIELPFIYTYTRWPEIHGPK